MTGSFLFRKPSDMVIIATKYVYSSLLIGKTLNVLTSPAFRLPLFRLFDGVGTCIEKRRIYQTTIHLQLHPIMPFGPFAVLYKDWLLPQLSEQLSPFASSLFLHFNCSSCFESMLVVHSCFIAFWASKGRVTGLKDFLLKLRIKK